MVAFLLPGYWLGLNIRSQAPPVNDWQPITVSNMVIPVRANDQRSFLLVNTSNLESNNLQLKSIWLASYIPHLEDIKLTPIYPDPSEQVNRQIEEAFSITKSCYGWALSPRLLAFLGQDNWWSGYLVLDEVFFVHMIDSVGGITISETLTGGKPAIAALNEAQPGHHPSITNQKILLRELCTRVTTLQGPPDLSVFDQMVGRHILTDLDSGQVLADWLAVLYHPGHQTKCEIPPIADPEAALPFNLQP